MISRIGLPRFFFGVYGIAAVAMALADTLFGNAVAAQTSFGYAPGWLREIAAFDLMLAFLCVRAVREPEDSSVVSSLASALALLSALIAANNLDAYVRSSVSGHLQAAVIHISACGTGIAVVRASARPRMNGT